MAPPIVVLAQYLSDHSWQEGPEYFRHSTHTRRMLSRAALGSVVVRHVRATRLLRTPRLSFGVEPVGLFVRPDDYVSAVDATGLLEHGLSF
jgi:hypothetical protein